MRLLLGLTLPLLNVLNPGNPMGHAVIPATMKMVMNEATLLKPMGECGKFVLFAVEKGEGDVVRATFEQKFGGSIIAGADLASQVIISAENPVHKDYIAIPFSFISVKKKKVLMVAIFKADNGSDFYFVCSEDGEPFVVASVASRISISPSYASLDVSAEQRVNGHKATLAWSAARVKEFETKRPSYLMRQYTATGKALVEACEEKGPAAASKIKAPNEADPPAAKRSAAPAELLVLPTTWSQIKKTNAPEVRRCPRSFKGQKAVRRLAGHPDGSQEDACRQAQDRAGGGSKAIPAK